MKTLLYFTIGFFLLINFQYFLFPLFGAFEIFVVIISFVILIGLIVMFIYHLAKGIKEKFGLKRRNALLLCLLITIGTTIYKPLGLIDFDNLQGKDVFIAQREGAANCMTTLKLKDSMTFIEYNYCFGTSRIKGTYRVKNDTLWLTSSDNYYDFGIFSNEDGIEKIVLYENQENKNPHWLTVTKNNL